MEQLYPALFIPVACCVRFQAILRSVLDLE